MIKVWTEDAIKKLMDSREWKEWYEGRASAKKNQIVEVESESN